MIGTILTPAYIYPAGNTWAEYLANFPVSAVIIANPSSGPGVSIDPNYTAAINSVGLLTVIGYVHTSFAARSLAAVEADIDTWYSFYPGIKGIFVDEVSATGPNFAYYQSIYNYIQTKSVSHQFVALNPGTTPTEQYMSISDTCVIYENTYTNWQVANPYAAWMTNYLASKLCLVIRAIPDTNGMRAVVAQGKSHNVGRYFPTDQTDYTTTPSAEFWTELLAALQDRGTGYFQDTCVRANQSLLGTASQGQVWAILAGNMTGSIASNKGNITGQNSDTIFTLGQNLAKNVDMIVRIQSPDYTGDIIGPAARIIDANNWYRPRLFQGNIDLMKLVGGVLSTFATTPFTFTANHAYWIRYRVFNTNHSIKVWDASGSEPSAWNINATDTSLQNQGKFGLECFTFSATDVMLFDNFTASIMPVPILQHAVFARIGQGRGRTGGIRPV